MSTISEAEVRFRIHTHHQNHHALVAVSGLDGRGIAAARCIRHEHDHESADVEVSVDEEWQGRGIGIELVRRMVEHARSLGVRRIVVAVPAQAEPSALTA
jgi:GNAT superfamily N-acetyltransferase